jgi:hypothetical protein
MAERRDEMRAASCQLPDNAEFLTGDVHMLTRRSLLALAAAFPALGAASLARAAEPMVFQRDGLAIGGTDPVAYVTEGGPVQGDPAYGADWNGARWTFASAANRDAFVADPGRYAPAFGGYCAFAASRGYLAPTIPEAWSLYEDRLYLNASLRARELWLAELPDVIAAGEANWPAILG